MFFYFFLSTTVEEEHDMAYTEESEGEGEHGQADDMDEVCR